MADVYIYPPNATETDTAKNGYGVLTAISAPVVEELVTGDAAGEYAARIEVSTRDRLADKVVDGAIVKLSTPTGMDLFRIDRTEKTLTRIIADCSHLTSDLRHSLVLNRYWAEKQLDEAWPEIVKAGHDQRFSGMSDITDTASLRLVRSNVLNGMIGRQDNTVLNRWGGEVHRHGWQIDMLQRRGADRHVTIRYGKNLVGINDEIDDRDTFNSVVATYLVSDTVAKEMPAIDSPLAATAPLKKTVAIHFGDIQVGKEVDGIVQYPNDLAAETEVAARVAQMWLDGADKPRATSVVEFVDLRRTEEYKALAALEEIQLGDTIRAILPGQIDITQRVIAYEWDALTERYTSLTLGSPKPTVGAWRNQLDNQLRTEISQNVNAMAESMITAVSNLNQTYVNAMGYYKTDVKNEATGAIQTYLHDEPELEESVFIATVPEAGSYMWTARGWNDGEPVWTQGISKEGNAIIRFISVIGLNAEWIQLANGDTVVDLADKVESWEAAQITGQYYISTSPSTLTGGSWSDTAPTSAQMAGKFVWTRTKTVYGNGDIEHSDPICVTGATGQKGTDGQDGLPGKDGVGVVDTVISYAKSASGTEIPTVGWGNQPPTPTKGQYLWTRTVWEYSDETTETGYSTAYWATDGASGTDGIAGADGVGIVGTNITYAASASGTVPPESGWGINPPSATAGQFVWTKTVWTYSDESTETGYSVGKIGETGADGQDGKDGQDGQSITIKGSIDDVDDLPVTADEGDVWSVVGADGITITLYAYTGGQWINIGQLQGGKGADGSPAYVHIAYADTSAGGGFSQSPTGKSYIGMYADHTAAASNTPSDYTWSLIKGADGLSGINTAIVFLYRRGATAPTKPSTASTYTFATGALTGQNNGWTQTIPATDGNPLWVIQAVASATAGTPTDSIAAGEWGTQIKLVEDGVKGNDGADGINGLSQATLFLYRRKAGTAPTTEDIAANLTYTFSNGVLSGALGAWSRTVPAGSDPLYVTTAAAISNTATDTISRAEWSAPVLMVKDGVDGQDGTDGNDGTDGVSVSSVIIQYAKHTSSTVAPTIGWADPPAPAWELGKYIWQRTKITLSNGNVTYVGAQCIESQMATQIVAHHEADLNPHSLRFTEVQQEINTMGDVVDSHGEAISELSANELVIRETLAVGGRNLLKNPTFGTPQLAELTGWTFGGLG